MEAVLRPFSGSKWSGRGPDQGGAGRPFDPGSGPLSGGRPLTAFIPTRIELRRRPLFLDRPHCWRHCFSAGRIIVLERKVRIRVIDGRTVRGAGDPVEDDDLRPLDQEEHDVADGRRVAGAVRDWESGCAAPEHGGERRTIGRRRGSHRRQWPVQMMLRDALRGQTIDQPRLGQGQRVRPHRGVHQVTLTSWPAE